MPGTYTIMWIGPRAARRLPLEILDDALAQVHASVMSTSSEQSAVLRLLEGTDEKTVMSVVTAAGYVVTGIETWTSPPMEIDTPSTGSPNISLFTRSPL